MKDTYRKAPKRIYPNLNFRLSKEDKEEVLIRAKVEGVSPSALVRRIILDYVLTPWQPMRNTPDPGDEQPEA